MLHALQTYLQKHYFKTCTHTCIPIYLQWHVNICLKLIYFQCVRVQMKLCVYFVVFTCLALIFPMIYCNLTNSTISQVRVCACVDMHMYICMCLLWCLLVLSIWHWWRGELGDENFNFFVIYFFKNSFF